MAPDFRREQARDFLPPGSRSRAGFGRGAYLDGIDRFDASFFRTAPVEARLLDPQQRLLLETSLGGFGGGGDRPRGAERQPHRCICRDLHQRVPGSDLELRPGDREPVRGDRHQLQHRDRGVAFTLGLEGPAMAVDTACSSSLVAVNQAVASLQRDEAISHWPVG